MNGMRAEMPASGHIDASVVRQEIPTNQEFIALGAIGKLKGPINRIEFLADPKHHQDIQFGYGGMVNLGTGTKYTYRVVKIPEKGPVMSRHIDAKRFSRMSQAEGKIVLKALGLGVDSEG